MEEVKQNSKKRRLTPLGYIFFTILLTFCTYAIVNFFIGGIPWQIILAAVILALAVWSLK